MRALHLDLPDVVTLQKDIEHRLNTTFKRLALTEDDFVSLYEEWSAHHER